MPEIANFFTQTRGFSAAAKLLAGMARQRQVPRFAAHTFKENFREDRPTQGKPEVLLWPDTFNNHFYLEVAVRCGERVLFPAVREAPDYTLIIADGFSCREQIRQGTAREALHSAQVLQMALRQTSAANAATLPERPFIARRKREHAAAQRKLVSIIAEAATLAALLFMQSRRNVRL